MRIIENHINENYQPHKINGPAKVWDDGSEEWYINGDCHRTDGPACTYPDNGEQRWYIRDQWIHTNTAFQIAAGISDEDMTAMVLKYGDVE